MVFKKKYEFEEEDDEYGDEEEEIEEEKPKKVIDLKRKPDGKFIKKKKNVEKLQFVFQAEQMGVLNTEDNSVDDLTHLNERQLIVYFGTKILNNQDKIMKAVL